MKPLKKTIKYKHKSRKIRRKSRKGRNKYRKNKSLLIGGTPNYSEEDIMYENAIKKRQEFSDICDRLFNQSNLKVYIENFLSELNDENETCGVIFGGNAWHTNFNFMYNAMDKFQKTACLPGNYDILILSSNNDETIKNNIQSVLTKTLDYAKQIGLQNVLFYNKDDFGNFYNGSSSYWIKADIGDEKQKLLLYIEFAKIQFDASIFKENFIDVKTGYLSPFGLFFFMNKMNVSDVNSRARNKLINVDGIRFILFRDHYLSKVIEKTKQSDVRYLILHLTFTLIPIIFPEKIIQEYLISNTFFNLIERFNCPIKYNNKDVNFDKFKQYIGSDNILNEACGGKNGCMLPSLRKLIQFILICINIYANDRCMVVGGDAFAYYDSTIEITSDIDAKYYYKLPNNKTFSIYVMFYLLEVIRLFIHTQQYFRLTRTYNIMVGNVPISLVIDTQSQEQISQIRYIPKTIFPVDLLSLDIQLKYNITINIASKDITKFSGKLFFSPLDIAFDNKNFKERNDVIINDYDVYNSNQESLNMVEYNGHYISTPVAEIDWLIDDLRENINNPIKAEQRRSVGKHEKDLVRYNRMMYLKNTLTNQEKKSLITKMDQVSPDHTNASHDIQNMLKYVFGSFNQLKNPKGRNVKTTDKVKNFLQKLNEPNNAFLLFLNRYIGGNVTPNNIQQYITGMFNITSIPKTKTVTTFKNYDISGTTKRTDKPLTTTGTRKRKINDINNLDDIMN